MQTQNKKVSLFFIAKFETDFDFMWIAFSALIRSQVFDKQVHLCALKNVDQYLQTTKAPQFYGNQLHRNNLTNLVFYSGSANHEAILSSFVFTEQSSDKNPISPTYCNKMEYANEDIRVSSC